MPELVRTVGRYRILREVGRGGMGVVYVARQLDLDRLVALKELAAFHAADPAFARRFVRESRLAGSLIHPNIVTVFDYFEHEGAPFIAMEYVERGSLRPYVGRLAPAQIGGVLEGVLAGLAAAEQRGIVHRDLKPENLMVTTDGGVKIADFGIAKATQDSQPGALVTATGTTLGTPPYMAPEQAMAREIGPWTDLYSVGCIAYEMFTGKPPFHDSDTPMAILLRHINETLAPAVEAADVDPDISRWIERLTAKDPVLRPKSSIVAWEELEEILIGKLGPRWRREARLPGPPSRTTEGGSSPTTPAPLEAERGTGPGEFESFAWGGATPVTGPEMPPPVEPAPPLEGIDVEGTGPDTGEALPAAGAAAEPGYQTYAPRAADRPAAGISPPPPAPPVPPPTFAAQPQPQPQHAGPGPKPAGAPAAAPPQPGSAPLPRRRARATSPGAGLSARQRIAARAGGAALLAALVIPVIASGFDRWNLFAVLSPFEAAGVALATWAVVQALSRARISVPFAAGVLVGFGFLTSIASLALLKFTLERLGAVSTVLDVVAIFGAVAILIVGVACMWSSSASEAVTPIDPGTLLLVLAGTALACAALFVRYDGFSSLWSEVGEGESAEFFFEPMYAVAAMLAGLVVLGTRPRFAAGLLLAVGTGIALHFLGLIVAAWRAIGEVGDVRAAGFIGLLGGLLVAGAGFSARRS